MKVLPLRLSLNLIFTKILIRVTHIELRSGLMEALILVLHGSSGLIFPDSLSGKIY